MCERLAGSCRNMDDDDFEEFMDSVKSRSLAARTRAICEQVPVDQQSTSSVASKEKTEDNSSSLDLEWDHEAGLPPIPKGEARKLLNRAEEDAALAQLAVRPTMLSLKQPLNDSVSQDNNKFEWDTQLEIEHRSQITKTEHVTLLKKSVKKVKR